MEQYLALQKALLVGNDVLAQKAIDSEDPSEHKAVLNQLKSTQNTDWQAKAPELITTAVRAKFGQNEHLANFLVETHPLRIGEASKDPFWGIGLTLESEQVLDVTRWSDQGNLLGRTLDKVRDELIQYFMYSN